MKNNQDVNSQLIRMRNLMKYGIDESKKTPYTGVEYEKENGGKLYGIVREGTKYYIKVSPNKKGKLAENYEYIGGFRNRKDNEYSSFADAQKNFDLKMMSINEANAPEKKIMVESWNPDKQEELTVESTDRMKREISRERQIMLNATRINEKKSQNLAPISETCKENCESECDGYDFKDAENPKDSFRKKKHEEGDAKKANPDYKDAKIEEASEPLAWHSTGKDAAGNIADTYMDKSHGTEIGDSAPFNDAKGKDIDDKEGTSTTGEMNNGVVEGKSMAMDNGDNQNSPAVGVGKIGDTAPFDAEDGRQIDEDIDDINADADVEDDDTPDVDDDVTPDAEGGADDDFADDADLGDEGDFGADDEGLDDDDVADDEGLDDDDTFDDDEDDDVDPDLHDLQDQISDLSDKLDAVLNAVGGDEPTVNDSEYEDDDLYDDDDDEPIEDGMAFESRRRNGAQVYESRAFRQMRMNEARRNRARRINEEDGMKPFSDAGRVPRGNMNKLNDFGKHPAYQKKVMNLPRTSMQEFPGYYDMNDDSVYNENPYGEKIGSGAPFEVDPEEIENTIAESIMRHLGKKYLR